MAINGAAAEIMAPIVTFGELLVDFVPTVPGLSLSDAPAFQKAAGGAPANVAVGVGKLGGQAAFIGKVGDDQFGRWLVATLKENHVNVTGVRKDAHAPTALAFVTLRDDGEREFMFFRNPSADMMMSTAELDEDLIRGSTVFHYGSISLISEPCRLAHHAAMKLAKESGSLLSYDPNLRLPLWPSPEAALKGIKSIWNQADIIKVSDDEVKFLTGGLDEKDNKVVKQLMHDDLKLLLVTDGPGGCRYFTKEFEGKVESFPVTAVDTTGAGDGFVAGLLNELVKNKGLLSDETALRAALQFANACGAITTTGRGAIPSLPDTDTVWDFIYKHRTTASPQLPRFDAANAAGRRLAGLRLPLDYS